MWNNNGFTRMLNIEYPIIQAPMAGKPTTPELAAEVSNAGGLGMVGAGYFSVDKVKDTVRQVKELPSLPFGVNLFVVDEQDISSDELEKGFDVLEPFRNELNMNNEMPDLRFDNHLETKIEVLIEENVPVCSFTFGIPSTEILNRLKDNGILTIGTATTVEEAKAIEQAGMDAVVMQGSEAGGHRATFLGEANDSMVGTIALVPQTVDHVSIPVIASGGIMDGRGCAAAYMLGAKAVQMGTAFLTTYESGAPHAQKEAILDANEDHTVITKAFSGKEARGIQNRFTRFMEEQPFILPYPIQNSLTKGIRSEAAKQDNAELMSLRSGQGNRLSTMIGARELFYKIVREVDQLLGG